MDLNEVMNLVPLVQEELSQSIAGNVVESARKVLSELNTKTNIYKDIEPDLLEKAVQEISKNVVSNGTTLVALFRQRGFRPAEIHRMVGLLYKKFVGDPTGVTQVVMSEKLGNLMNSNSDTAKEINNCIRREVFESWKNDEI